MAVSFGPGRRFRQGWKEHELARIPTSFPGTLAARRSRPNLLFHDNGGRCGPALGMRPLFAGAGQRRRISPGGWNLVQAHYTMPDSG